MQRMIERLPCQMPGCPGTILPSTAEATGGFCKPCVNKRRADEHARYVAAHRVDVDRFAGIDDPVEIVRLIHQDPPRDELKNYLPCGQSAAELYRALTQGEAHRLVASAATDPKLLRQVATHLACFAVVDLTACQARILDHGDPYPSHAFRGATEPVVHRLFGLLDGAVREGDELLLSHALSALAWTRSGRALDAMMAWHAAPPVWRNKLHWAPHQYAWVAGYAVDDGGVRDLVRGVAMKLSPGNVGTATPPVTLFEPDPSGKLCPRCGRPATLLLRVDAGGRAGGSAGLRGVPTCLDCCTTGQPVFVRFQDTISWTWALSGPTPTSPLTEFPHLPRHVGETVTLEGWDLPRTAASLAPRSSWEAVDWCIADGISQLGGHPSWINDPVYPTCPVCSRSTMTVAQVALDDFVGPADGVFYVHSCETCAVVGVSYDQT
jgi:hypothetical protein